MALPAWAERALEQFKPKSPYRGDGPDIAFLRQWDTFRRRFTDRWSEVAPDQWKVPEDHPSYAWLRRNYVFPPADYVRQCILEVAIECAWELGVNKPPAAVIEAVKELDRLNEQISESAKELAALFRQRDQLRFDYSLSDRTRDAEPGSPDPFTLPGVMEMTFKKYQFRTSSYCFKDGLNTLYDALSSSGGDAPTIADLLDEISWRMPRVVTSFDAGDIAVIGSKTNRSEWSTWALRLVARLRDWAGNGLPDGFFLSCLTHDQIATLLTVVIDAPPGVYNGPQMRELIKRHKARAAS